MTWPHFRGQTIEIIFEFVHIKHLEAEIWPWETTNITDFAKYQVFRVIHVILCEGAHKGQIIEVNPFCYLNRYKMSFFSPKSSREHFWVHVNRTSGSQYVAMRNQQLQWFYTPQLHVCFKSQKSNLKNHLWVENNFFIMTKIVIMSIPCVSCKETCLIDMYNMDGNHGYTFLLPPWPYWTSCHIQ